ncbi:hypothetical protein TWF481_004931 [Arthrobotrys musiformis]|uniref:Uncharacterized protein n=1 Tax=Arthrobotrys musiformis TaxID=47236 RepID=A0AAV9WLD6_9PEZI
MPPSNQSSPASSPISRRPPNIPTSLVIPTVITETELRSQSPSGKFDGKSPLTAESKTRTGIPIIIETTCGSWYPRLGGTAQSISALASIDIAARNPILEESDHSYFEVGAELDDEDYFVDEYCHAGHKSALSFTEGVFYPKGSPAESSPQSNISSQPLPAEECLIQKGFRVKVREYEVEKPEPSEQDDDESSDGVCCLCLRWLKTYWVANFDG